MVLDDEAHETPGKTNKKLAMRMTQSARQKQPILTAALALTRLESSRLVRYVSFMFILIIYTLFGSMATGLAAGNALRGTTGSNAT
jgi:hypothetical protein